MISKYDTFFIDSLKDLTELDKNEYDLFISSFNDEAMVQDLFDSINSTKKIWCVLPDYTLNSRDSIENSEYFELDDINILSDTLESEYIDKFIEKYELIEYISKTLCIDITGFVKPYIIYLIYALKEYGFNSIDIIYSEPKYWENLDETIFSKETIIKTRPINGFDIRVENGNNNLQIIAAGYDHKLIRASASYNKLVKQKQVLIGFPSLQPSMYQENILNFQKAADELAIDYDNFNPIFAPANDPFEAAKVLKEYVDSYIEQNDDITAVYLSPLSTKPHALGMLLFFLYEGDFYKEKNIEIIMLYPFTKSYSSSAGKQLAKINLYTLEF